MEGMVEMEAGAIPCLSRQLMCQLIYQGLFGGRWYFKLFNLAIGLGALSLACLGENRLYGRG